MAENKETAAEAIRDIHKKQQQANLLSSIIILLLLGGIVAYCSHINSEVEADIKWCREAPAKEFVDQFEAKCLTGTSIWMRPIE